MNKSFARGLILIYSSYIVLALNFNDWKDNFVFGICIGLNLIGTIIITLRIRVQTLLGKALLKRRLMAGKK